MKPLTYRHTRLACYMGYIVQAVINNLSPLLFITFQQEFSLSLSQISLIITVNFSIQMLVDVLSAKFVDRIGYRACAVGAHIFSCLGLLGLALLPSLLPPYAGLMAATALCALSGGLLEVLVSPIIEALPGERKESEMSLLHSFYCWGHVGVVLLSTAFFLLAGRENWRLLPCLWALLPLCNAFLFARTPLCALVEEGKGLSLKRLLSMPVFWLFFLLMLCAGASEQAMSQWASLFAELGLNVSKTLGDLLGPCAFAALMGLARVLFSRTKGLPTTAALLLSGGLCIASYLLAVFSPSPLLSLIGCAACGFSVGVMWPGVFSLASARMPRGGTALFALLALAGDIGCCAGPSLVGALSDAVQTGASSPLAALFQTAPITQLALKTGFLAAILFPALLTAGVLLLRRKRAPGALE